MIKVATARNKSTTLVFFQKNDRQSGNEIPNRIIISISKMTVATVSVTPRRQLGREDAYLKGVLTGRSLLLSSKLG